MRVDGFEVRGVHGGRLDGSRDLFWNGHHAGAHRLCLAAETIVPGEVEHDFDHVL